MSKFTSIPDFYDSESAMATIRALKATVEQLAGLRQGPSLGAPSIYMQSFAPVATRDTVLARGDLWIDDLTGLSYFWTGSAWSAVGGQRTPAVTLSSANKIINGNFRVWQRATSQTTSGYGSADRWRSAFAGGTVTMSRQSFSAGTMLGRNEPLFFCRQAISGQTLASHVAVVQQFVERARSYADQTITVMGWARREAGSGNMAVSVSQKFGTGGSPSAQVDLAGQIVPLSVAWAPFAVTFVTPSLSGKTFGTNGDDHFEVSFWGSAGSDWNTRAGNLGLQTITFDLWGVHVLPGAYTASDTETYCERDVGTELAACQRYYERFVGGAYIPSAVAGNYFGAVANFAVQKRVSPAGAITRISDLSAVNVNANPYTEHTTENGTRAMAQVTANGSAGFQTLFAADAEIP